MNMRCVPAGAGCASTVTNPLIALSHPLPLVILAEGDQQRRLPASTLEADVEPDQIRQVVRRRPFSVPGRRLSRVQSPEIGELQRGYADQCLGSDLSGSR